MRYRTVRHILRSNPLHPYPLRYRHSRLRTLRHLAQYHLDGRMLRNLVGKHIHIHRRHAEMSIVVALTQHGDIKLIIILRHVHTGIESILPRLYILGSQPLNRNIILILVVTFHLKIIRMIRPQVQSIPHLISSPVISRIETMQLHGSSIPVGKIRLVTLLLVILDAVRIQPAPLTRQRRIGPLLTLVHLPFRILHILIHVESKSNLPVLVEDSTLQRSSDILRPPLLPAGTRLGIHLGSRKRTPHRHILCRPLHKCQRRQIAILHITRKLYIHVDTRHQSLQFYTALPLYSLLRLGQVYHLAPHHRHTLRRQAQRDILGHIDKTFQVRQVTDTVGTPVIVLIRAEDRGIHIRHGINGRAFRKPLIRKQSIIYLEQNLPPSGSIIPALPRSIRIPRKIPPLQVLAVRAEKENIKLVDSLLILILYVTRPRSHLQLIHRVAGETQRHPAARRRYRISQQFILLAGTEPCK